MSTSGGFTPPATPECPYAPRMTRAAALALRAASGLKENCVVVITDGPTIGTAGNTSLTEIELNPVSPTELGTTARVHTTFAASAWPGVYDIDLGAAGTITELRDDWGNFAKDIDSGSPTVTTQFPWHAGGPLLRDNRVEDATLIGWDTAAAAGATINNNVIGTPGPSGVSGATRVDLTGLSATSIFSGNTIACTVDITTPLAAGSQFTDNIVRDDFALNLAPGATAGQLVFDGNTFYDHNAANAGYDFVYNGDSTNVATFNDNEFRGTNAATQYNFGGTGTFSAFVAASKFNGPTITRQAGTLGSLLINQAELVNGVFSLDGAAGTINISSGSRVLGGTITRDLTATGGLTISASTVGFCTLSQGAGSTGAMNLTDSDVQSTTLTISAGSAKGISVSNSKAQSYRVVTSDTGGSGLSASNMILTARPNLGDSVNIRGVGGAGVTMGSGFHDGFSQAGAGTGSIDMDTAASSALHADCEIRNSRLICGPGTGAFQTTGLNANQATINSLGTGRLTIRNTLVQSAAVTLAAAATGNMTIDGSTVNSGGLVEHQTGPRDIGITDTTVSGSGSILRQASVNAASVPNSNAVNSTRILDGGRVIFSETAAAGQVGNSVNRSTVKSNSLGAGVDGILTITGLSAFVVVDDLDTEGIVTLTDVPAGALSAGTAFHNLRVGPASTLTYTAGDATAKQIRNITVEDLSTLTMTGLTGSAGVGLADVFAGRVKGQSTMTVTGARVVGQPVRNFTVEDGSTLNVAASGTVLQCQVRAGATLNTGAFRHSESVVEGAITKTATAANVNKLANKSFDDWI